MPDLPFLDRMGLAFLFCSFLLAFISGIQTDDDEATTTKPVFRYILVALLSMVAVATTAKMALTGAGTEQLVGIIGLVASAAMIYVMLSERGRASLKAIDISPKLFRTGGVFNVTAFAVLIFLTVFYLLLRDPIG